MTDTYHGWTNYATWRINLELIDGLDVEDFGVEPQGEDRDDDTRELASVLETYVDDHLSESVLSGSDGLVLDYARAFVSDVNWCEIAEHLIGAWADDHEDAYTPHINEDEVPR